MKIHFTLSYRTAVSHKDTLSSLIEKLEKNGHTITKRPFNVSEEEAKNPKTPLIEYVVGTSVSNIYKTTLRRIREADVVIADNTIPSSGVGYELAIAQNEKKPVLILHNSKAADLSMAGVLEGNQNKLTQVSSYSTPDELISNVDSFLEDSKGKLDTKFILIISPEIDRYISWASDERRMHKAQIVRNAVEDTLAADKEYQAYLDKTA